MALSSTAGPDAGYLAIVYPDRCTDGNLTWAADHPDLPGCRSQGDTSEDALLNLGEARELYLNDLCERGLRPPKPGGSRIARTILDAMSTESSART